MRADHLEIMVEEPSMEAFLREILPGLLGSETSFEVYRHQCKDDLLGKLPARLKGYANWLPDSWRIVVVVDRDDDQCAKLKARMNRMAAEAHLRSRSHAGNRPWQIANRIAIEELEAWYFGDWEAVCESYPRVSSLIPGKAQFRDSDAISGGTWEAFERVLQKAGYFKNGLRKLEIARQIGARFVPERNRSRSFQVFRDLLLEAVA